MSFSVVVTMMFCASDEDVIKERISVCCRFMLELRGK